MSEASNDKLTDIRAKIEKIYINFHNKFNREKCPNIFRYFDQEAEKYSLNGGGHELGHFAILYTPVNILNPDLMLVGNNPSWFHPSDMGEALKIVKVVESGIPADNSYLIHEHAFAKQLQSIFDVGLRKPDLLKSCVGMNRFWVQTGSGGIGDLHKDDRSEEYKKLEEYCERKTRAIVGLIQPKLVMLLGAPARKAFPSSCRDQFQHIAFEEARHPSFSGVVKCRKSIQIALERHGIG